MPSIRRILVAFRGKRVFAFPAYENSSISPYETQDRICEMLLSNCPCMIARFGSVELQAVVDFLNPPTVKNAFQFVRGKIPSWGYAPSTIRTMHINAGFFPPTRPMLDRFGSLMMECMSKVDILGSWRPEESVVLQYMPNVVLAPLYTLEPYYFDNPWMQALEGKKVLVIHPFEDTILRQHEKGRYELLFENKRLTPSFELQTLKAVQSIAGNKPDKFDDWFQALDWMKCEIDKREFDIAIIGCGAYGFPLAAYVKQIGKKAVHLGGAVQYLFGIKSNAAESNARLSSLINPYWVKPLKEETPRGVEKVEQSRYW